MLWHEEAPIPAEKIGTVVEKRDPERLRERPWSTSEIRRQNRVHPAGTFAPNARNPLPPYDLPRPDEAAVRHPNSVGDQVDGVVKTIGEVAVDVTSDPEHRRVARCLAAVRVGAGVAFARIRLYLGNANAHGPGRVRPFQVATEQGRGDVKHVSLEEGPTDRNESIHSRLSQRTQL